jgi:hypothetical protein
MCPVSTGGGTRCVQLVRGGKGGGHARSDVGGPLWGGKGLGAGGQADPAATWTILTPSNPSARTGMNADLPAEGAPSSPCSLVPIE